MKRLIRFTLSRWRSQQESIVNRPPQTERGLNVSTQVGDHNLFVDDTIRADSCASSRQCEIDNSVCMSEGGDHLVKNEGGMGNVENRQGGFASRGCSVNRLPILTPYWSAPLMVDSFRRQF
jgi:hypothetical protein